FYCFLFFFFFSSRRRHTRSYGDWSSDVCSSDLMTFSHSTSLGVCLPNDVEWLKVIVQTEKKAHTISYCRVIFRAQGLLRIEPIRSEERRVGKECRCKWWTDA